MKIVQITAYRRITPLFDHMTNMTHDEKMTPEEIEEGKRDYMQ